jgi:hypothetical protein
LIRRDDFDRRIFFHRRQETGLTLFRAFAPRTVSQQDDFAFSADRFRQSLARETSPFFIVGGNVADNLRSFAQPAIENDDRNSFLMSFLNDVDQRLRIIGS